MGKLERGLPAELHDDAMQMPTRALDIDDLEHVLAGQRLEIQPIGSVVVGRDRFRVAVDHDGLVTGLLQGKSGMAAAVVELDALPDPVGPPAEDHDLDVL